MAVIERYDGKSRGWSLPYEFSADDVSVVQSQFAFIFDTMAGLLDLDRNEDVDNAMRSVWGAILHLKAKR